jgi:hypothetical protein
MSDRHRSENENNTGVVYFFTISGANPDVNGPGKIGEG